MKRRRFLRLASGLLVPAYCARAATPSFYGTCRSFGSTITPQSFPNLWAWYKADSFVGSDGDAVGTWSDGSGNARDATQSSGTNKPVYHTNKFNSLPAIQFTTGASKYLDIPSLSIGSSGAFTFVKVGNVNGDSMFLQSGSSVQLREDFTGNSKRISYWGTINSSDVFTTVDGLVQANLHMVVFRRNAGTTLSWRENKNSRNTATDGGSFTVNRLSSDFQPCVGFMCEIALYTGILSDADCDSLYDNYFKSRWGLP